MAQFSQIREICQPASRITGGSFSFGSDQRGSLDSTLATFPYAIKSQRKARNAPSRGHFVPKPLVGGFGCLELVLYGIRELA